MNATQRMVKALNRLAKWRTVYTGRILGTKPVTDAPTQGFRDIFERLLLLRVEVSALTGLLLTAGVFTAEQLENALANEADFLNEALERVFPGIRATDEGIAMDPRAANTMKGWPA